MAVKLYVVHCWAPEQIVLRIMSWFMLTGYLFSAENMYPDCKLPEIIWKMKRKQQLHIKCFFQSHNSLANWILLIIVCWHQFTRLPHLNLLICLSNILAFSVFHQVNSEWSSVSSKGAVSKLLFSERFALFRLFICIPNEVWSEAQGPDLNLFGYWWLSGWLVTQGRM